MTRLDLKQIPFSGRMSRHMIFEETDNLGAGWIKGLFLALATEGGSLFGGPVVGSKGFLGVTPLAGGNPIDYTCNATPSVVTLETAGGMARFALPDERSLRVEGDSALMQ